MNTGAKSGYSPIRALLSEIGTLILANAPPADGRLAQLRWTLVREHMIHSRCERAAAANHLSPSFTLNSTIDTLGEQVLRQVKFWNEATIIADWQGYRLETGTLTRQLSVQINEEERRLLVDA